MKSNNIMKIDTFIRALEVNRARPHSLLLGAGASISSGIPSANTCIWHWKRQIFTSNNPLLAEQVSELGIPSVRAQIQKWLDSNGGYPALDSNEEYGFYAEECFPVAEDRRQYFSQLVDSRQPYVGYQWLCLLAELNIIQYVWTTNFDRLTVKAAMNSNVTPIEVGLDTAGRITRTSRELGQLVCVALHGDYRYDNLKNTDAEVQNQDKQIHLALQKHLCDSNLIVIGYSGRDASIMQSLSEAYSQPGNGRLYWCGFGEDSTPNAAVQKLLDTASSAGRQAFYVPSLGFDDLMWRATELLAGNSSTKTKEIYAQYQSTNQQKTTPFKIPAPNKNVKTTNVIKSNSFAITCPTDIYQFAAKGFDSPGAWSRLRSQIDGTSIVAGLLGGRVFAFGEIAELKRVFAKNLDGAIQRVSISTTDLSYENGVMINLLTNALARALADKHKLVSNKKNLIWKPKHSSKFTYNNIAYDVADAIRISLRLQSAQLRLIIEPTIELLAKSSQIVTREAREAAKRKLLAGQYNKQFNQKLDEWRNLLFSKNQLPIYFPSSSKQSFAFSINNAPDYASIVEYMPQRSINIPNNFISIVTQHGMQFREPNLLFSNNLGTDSERDTHSLRGLSRNKPYDYSLTKQGLETEIKLGVICPSIDAHKLQSFLLGLHQSSKVSSNQEYMVDYRGFGVEFGLPLQVPTSSETRWATCPEVDQSLNVKQGARLLQQQLTQSINSLMASSTPNVIIIYVPSRWKKWESYREDNEYFDLHDFIKAYCVEKGISSQFLREKTLADPDPCRVKWWISLALYAKSMRTPWALESQDSETAFLGIGMSIDQTAMRNNQYILGCSHIYNSKGIGLTYKLSKIHDPIWRNRNPFLGVNDARRMGDTSRQLFFASLGKLPKRVVIHKRTPFSDQEMRGLREGLSGIDSIDMLEISIDPARRYVSSRYKNSKFVEDGFPVKRGTTVLLDKRSALCWVHGSTAAIQPHRTYYQGKRRIPAPLKITRHFGSSPLYTLVPELLGLSKMNWNTFDMYTKLPATIQSSNSIARIGSNLSRFGDNSYDYRLFI